MQSNIIKNKINEVISNNNLTEEQKKSKVNFLKNLVKLKKEIMDFDKFTKNYISGF